MRSTFHIAAANAALEAGMERGLRLAGELILDDSTRHVPYEDGPLSRTGAFDVEGTAVVVSYRDADYPGQAVQQHEDTSLKHDEGRNAKFLENAFNAKKDTAIRIVATNIRRAMSAGAPGETA